VSASYEGYTDMRQGRTVYSNYPIIAPETQKDGSIITYESLPIDTNELLYIDDPTVKAKYQDTVVIWDEGALSLFSRDFMSARNRLMSQAVQLIGKLEMNIYFTCQFLSLMDKNIRQQADAHIFCHDLSFKYKRFKRGTKIGQSYQDISGRFTGDTYELNPVVYYQIFNATDYWEIYDTTQTFAVMQQRLKMKDIRAGLSAGADVIDLPTTEESEELQSSIIEHLVREFQDAKNFKMRQSLIHTVAKERGFVGNHHRLAYELLQTGARNYVSGGVQSWDMTDAMLVPVLVGGEEGQNPL